MIKKIPKFKVNDLVRISLKRRQDNCLINQVGT